MDKIKSYFKGRKWNWWLSNFFMVAIIVILIVPSWRLKFSTMVNSIFLTSPDFEDQKTATQTHLDWNMISLQNETLNLSQSAGKVIFINSWATWCGPCRSELPSMDKLYEKYKDKVDFYFVSSEEISKLNEFKQKMDYSIPIYKSNYYPEEFAVSTIPSSFIVNKKGEIVYTKIGTADWNSESAYAFLDQLLDE